jgi:phosphoenolpyruvate phosphomutase
MEAHDGLSAKIVEETGFEAIWASGLSITASLGVRDNNEISYTQLLNVLEYMTDACDLPILVDGDTGYGNFNNASIFVQKLESRGIAAVCVEDKKFPKTNSFLENALDALADPNEFTGKIRAMKAAQRTKAFSVIARLESLIIGAGVTDAVKRAKLYVEAGADALLVHSKRSDSKDIDDFLSAFEMNVPIFIVPTKYYSIPVSHLTADKRIKGIIWANHNLRACITAMQNLCKRIYMDASIANVEDSIAAVSEIFRLQDNEEYLEMEKKYLPSSKHVSAVILAAGSPGSLNFNKPKSLLVVNGESILERQCDVLKSCGINNTVVVRGYKKNEIVGDEFEIVDNDDWASTGMMYSLSLVAVMQKNPFIVLNGDVFFKKHLLRHMLDYANSHLAGDIVIACVKENYIYSGYSFRTTPTAIFDDDKIEVIDVCGEKAIPSDKGDKIVYFGGIMIVNNYDKIRVLLQCSDIRRLKSGEFFRRAIQNKLKLSVVVAPYDALVDINSVNDMVKAGQNI